jgi:hypothetical protein
VDYTVSDVHLNAAKRIVDAALVSAAGAEPIVMVLACGFLLERARRLAGSTEQEADQLLATLLERARRMVRQ